MLIVSLHAYIRIAVVVVIVRSVVRHPHLPASFHQPPPLPPSRHSLHPPFSTNQGSRCTDTTTCSNITTSSTSSFFPRLRHRQSLLILSSPHSSSSSFQLPPIREPILPPLPSLAVPRSATPPPPLVYASTQVGAVMTSHRERLLIGLHLAWRGSPVAASMIGLWIGKANECKSTTTRG